MQHTLGTEVGRTEVGSTVDVLVLGLVKASSVSTGTPQNFWISKS
jgi:hypothetical protein